MVSNGIVKEWIIWALHHFMLKKTPILHLSFHQMFQVLYWLVFEEYSNEGKSGNTFGKKKLNPTACMNFNRLIDKHSKDFRVFGNEFYGI